MGGNGEELGPIAIVIPAYNEEESIARVLHDLPAGLGRASIVVDNASSDRTAEVAREAGATVVFEARRGYGSACLRGIASVAPDVEVVVFLDGDYSDHPDELPSLVRPILANRADLVIGSRVLGECEPGALLPQARVGNRLAVFLIRCLWGYAYTDLGPFRAIRKSALEQLGMRDRDFGWTVEMQIRALEEGLRICEVPVSYRRRLGRSKITGTIRGSISAGAKILYTIGKLALRSGRGGSGGGRGRTGQSPAS